MADKSQFTVKDLKQIAMRYNISGYSTLNNDQLWDLVKFRIKTSLGNKEKICPRNYVEKQILGQGVYGTIYHACKMDDCNYAVKMVKIDDNPVYDPVDKYAWLSSITSVEAFEREILMTREAARLGISPDIIDSWICIVDGQRWGVYVTKLLNITLGEWLNENTSKEECKHVYNMLLNQLDKMHSNDLYHLDLHNGNVMLSLDDADYPVELYIIDWGISGYGSELPLELKKKTLESYEIFKSVMNELFCE